MAELAETKQFRSTGIVATTIIVLLALAFHLSRSLPLIGSYSSNLLTITNQNQLVGWGSALETHPLVGFMPPIADPTRILSAALFLGVICALYAQSTLVHRATMLPSTTYLGGAIYALLILTAPARSGTLLSASFLPLLLMVQSPARAAAVSATWTLLVGDLLTAALVALFSKHRAAALLGVSLVVIAVPTLREQLPLMLNAVRYAPPHSLALETLGLSAPDFHNYPLAAFALGFVLLQRSRSERAAKPCDRLLLPSTLSFFFCATTYPFFAASVSLFISQEAGTWLTRGVGQFRTHWSMVTVFALLVALVGAKFSDANVPVVEAAMVRQLRAPLHDTQAAGPLLADARFGTALLSAGFSPFVDLRVSAYSLTNGNSITGTAFSDYEELMKLRPRWESVLEHYKFKTALLPSNSPIVEILKTRFGWREVATSDAWIEWERGARKTRYLSLITAPG